jgi:hypothetical protein
VLERESRGERRVAPAPELEMMVEDVHGHTRPPGKSSARRAAPSPVPHPRPMRGAAGSA